MIINNKDLIYTQTMKLLKPEKFPLPAGIDLSMAAELPFVADNIIPWVPVLKFVVSADIVAPDPPTVQSETFSKSSNKVPSPLL